MASPIKKRVTGSLTQVLKSSPVAWYQGEDGTRAYVELPRAKILGLIAVNGKKILSIKDDGQDELSASLKVQLLSYGVVLDRGWTCREIVYGEHINDAIKASQYAAARHENGSISVQKINDGNAVIFINGHPHWTVKIAVAHNALEELGVVTWTGWHPVQQDLQRVSESRHTYRRELI